MSAKKVKSPGFYVPMDIAPGEYGSSVDYKALKAGIESVLLEDWGPPCIIKDTEDFPDLVGKTELFDGRCPCCLVYEKFDDFWEYFGHDDTDDL